MSWAAHHAKTRLRRHNPNNQMARVSGHFLFLPTEPKRGGTSRDLGSPRTYKTTVQINLAAGIAPRDVVPSLDTQHLTDYF